MSTDELRQRIKAKLKELSSEERERESQKVTQKSLDVLSDRLKKSKRIGAFHSLDFEFQTSELIKALQIKRISLCFPKIRSTQERSMEFCEVENPESHSWSSNSYGIREPGADSRTVRLDEMDLIFVPGILFGPNGARVGQGMGFFDRYLSESKNVYKVGLGLDLQWIPNLTQESWDVPMDAVFCGTHQYVRIEDK